MSSAADVTRQDGPSTTVSVPLDQRAKHPDLWFEDGSVVLATSDTLFRVYRGTLSRYSPVFRDLFSLPQPTSTSDQDMLDGIPVVHLYDDPTQLAHFLNALHDRLYYCHNEVTDFAIITSILRLSTKYQIKVIREQAISQLATLYPDKLEAFSHFADNRLVEPATEDDVDMILIARETNALRLLPLAFYSVVTSHLPEDASVDDDDDEFSEFWGGEVDTWSKLSKEDLARIAFGREKLRRAFYLKMGKFLYEPSPENCLDEHCDLYKSMLRADTWWIEQSGRSDVLSRHIVDNFTERLADLCPVCEEALRSSIEEGRRKIWEKLPSYFGLQDWEALKATTAQFVTDP